jgi:hypothetical protein
MPSRRGRGGRWNKPLVVRLTHMRNTIPYVSSAIFFGLAIWFALGDPLNHLK